MKIIKAALLVMLVIAVLDMVNINLDVAGLLVQGGAIMKTAIINFLHQFLNIL